MKWKERMENQPVTIIITIWLYCTIQSIIHWVYTYFVPASSYFFVRAGIMKQQQRPPQKRSLKMSKRSIKWDISVLSIRIIVRPWVDENGSASAEFASLVRLNLKCESKNIRHWPERLLVPYFWVDSCQYHSAFALLFPCTQVHIYSSRFGTLMLACCHTHCALCVRLYLRAGGRAHAHTLSSKAFSYSHSCSRVRVYDSFC